MAALVTRKLQYDDRVALQQADQAIRKDVIRALVELITNSNDSYHRIENMGGEVSGIIVVEIQRRHTNSVMRVRDHAEGMTGDQMDEKVGTYGAATSGFGEGKSVRGMWGRGLKDAFYGLGHGNVISFSEGWFHSCSLLIKGSTPTYEREQPNRATKALRSQHDMLSGNGTVMEIVVSRPDVRIPQFDNMRHMLERHYELREIMSNPHRKVLLRELDGRGKTKQEVQLSYKPPVSVKILDDVFRVPNYPASVHLEVYRADVPLSTPSEEYDYADGGLLVLSKHVVLALTLLKFENNEYASRFYGRITCDYLHDLLKKEPPEPVLTATRDGINWRHEFARALKAEVEARLEPLVEEERRRAQAEERSTINKRLKERLSRALRELNEIASSELGSVGNGVGGDGSNTGKIPFVPPNGFGFVPDYAYIQTGKPAGLTLRAKVPDKVEAGTLVTIESDSPEVVVLTPKIIIEERADYLGIGQALVQVEGRQVGAEAIIIAQTDGLRAEALVKVISKREPPSELHPPKTHGGFFHEIKFDPAAEPKQRVRFDRTTSNIIIATKAPSVAAYLDETGRGADQPQGQVLLAELITEAVCRAIAQRGVERGNFLFVPGAEADATQREFIRLQNQYAHHIHACFVDANYRRQGTDDKKKRKGRPTREEFLSKAVTEA